MQEHAFSRPIAEFLDVGAGASVHEGGMAVMVTDGALAPPRAG